MRSFFSPGIFKWIMSTTLRSSSSRPSLPSLLLEAAFSTSPPCTTLVKFSFESFLHWSSSKRRLYKQQQERSVIGSHYSKLRDFKLYQNTHLSAFSNIKKLVQELFALLRGKWRVFTSLFRKNLSTTVSKARYH